MPFVRRSRWRIPSTHWPREPRRSTSPGRRPPAPPPRPSRSEEIARTLYAREALLALREAPSAHQTPRAHLASRAHLTPRALLALPAHQAPPLLEAMRRSATRLGRSPEL